MNAVVFCNFCKSKDYYKATCGNHRSSHSLSLIFNLHLINMFKLN
jgi:hypothetical protein